MNKEHISLEFGLWLRDRRLDLGFTIGQFAEKCNLSYVTISNLELGKTLPGIHATKLIANVLDMEYVDLRQEIKSKGML